MTVELGVAHPLAFPFCHPVFSSSSLARASVLVWVLSLQREDMISTLVLGQSFPFLVVSRSGQVAPSPVTGSEAVFPDQKLF